VQQANNQRLASSSESKTFLSTLGGQLFASLYLLNYSFPPLSCILTAGTVLGWDFHGGVSYGQGVR